MPEYRLGRFGDRRLAETANALLEAMQKQQTMCLHALADSRGQKRRFNDFLDNEAVTRHEMLAHAGRLTARRVVGRNVVVVSDTSEHNYASHSGRKRGFGTVGNGVDIGVLIHPLVALDAETGGVVGLVGAEVINRPPGQAADRKTRPADQKESRRWLAGVETAGDVLADAAMITMVEDREGDIYDQFARRPANVHLLIRAAQNRALADGQKLFGACTGWPEVARYTITVPAKGGGGRSQRAGRSAVVGVRLGEVTLLRPCSGSAELPQHLTLRVVDVCEVDPPDPKQRVRWCLLTTHRVSTPAEAMQMVRWYRLRWTIEQVFRTMKTDGVDVESSQITTPGSLLKLVTVALIAAVRVMQLVIGRDGCTGQKLDDVVVDPTEVPALQAINRTLEGRTEKLKNPHDPTALAWYSWIAARLGGWSGYTSKGYKPAGPKIMARGLKRLDAIVEGWMLANRSALTGLP
ncbi:MAG: IS4 family transposase [Acetobacteraceae bacterium]